MASAGLLALIDDIATLLDDVAILSKIAAKKTAGVLGDDLALNAQQVSGVKAERELPVVWAVARGSARNKAILVPAALLLSYFLPGLITPLLMLGGAFLCYEGFEKVAEKLFHKPEKKDRQQQLMAGLTDPAFDLVAFEQQKIRGAIRTDFILSAEIVVISLGIVQEAALPQQIVTLCVIAAAMTVGVYGLVAAIVKLDDLGLHLTKTERPDSLGSLTRKLGWGLLSVCPYLMSGLSIAGTAAMFLVGGGILVHSVPAAHHLLQDVIQGAALEWIPLFLREILFNALIGIAAGGCIVATLTAFTKLRQKLR